MPKVNEIRRGKEIGFSLYTKFIWLPCEDCGKKRWVMLIKGNAPQSKMCRFCAITRAHQTLKQRGQKAENSPSWKGGRKREADGYIAIYVKPDGFYAPMANKRYVLEHRLVMAKHLKRCLLSWEIVHHKNGVRDDNRLENLELLPAPYKHNALTRLGQQLQRIIKQNEALLQTQRELKQEIRLLRLENKLLKEGGKVT